MTKPLCDLTKKIQKDPQAFAVYVRNATHICKECGRRTTRSDFANPCDSKIDVASKVRQLVIK